MWNDSQYSDQHRVLKCKYSYYTHSVKTCYRCIPSYEGDELWPNWRVPMRHETFLQTRADPWPLEWSITNLVEKQTLMKKFRFLSTSVTPVPPLKRETERESLDEKRWLDSCASCCIWLDWVAENCCMHCGRRQTQGNMHIWAKAIVLFTCMTANEA